MALQSSGAISIGDVAAEFGGSTPHALSEYYGAATGVPTSGTIALSDFYGTSSSGSSGGTATLTPDEDGSYESVWTYLRHDRRGFGADGKCDFYYPESVGTTYDDAFGSLTNTTGLISNCTVTSVAIVNITSNSNKILLVQVQGTVTQSSFSSIAFNGYLPSANSNQTITLSTSAGSCYFSTPYRLNQNGVANMKEWAWLLGTFGTVSQSSGTTGLSNLWSIITYADANNATVGITIS